MKNLSQFINSANTPQNTGGGTSHSSTVVTPVWKGSRPTVSRRSTDSQPKEHRTHTLLSKALKYAAMILLTLTLGIGNAWGETTTWTHGFEDNTAWSGSNTSNRANSATAKRTGGKGAYATCSAGSGRLIKGGSVDYNKDNTYTVMCWMKLSVAGKAGINVAGAGGNDFDLSANTWTLIYKQFTASGNQTGKNIQPTCSIASNCTIYVDDVVFYKGTYDNVKPTSASSASATTSSISWTYGTDANTGVQNTLIWRRTGGSSDDLTLNNQGVYAASATDQSEHWTCVSATESATATSYSGTFSVGDRYAIVHRDLAYNYSTPAYVTISDGTPVVDVTPPTLSSSSPADEATSVALSGNIVLTMSENVSVADASKFTLSGGAGSLTTANISASGTAVTIPYTGLANSTEYTLTAAAGAIQDGADTPNTNEAFSISFTTICLSPSIAWGTEPTGGEVGDDDVVATVTTTPGEQTITWTSSRTAVATVTNGTIHYVAPGFTNISAEFTYSGSDYCEDKASVNKDIVVPITTTATGTNDKYWYYTSTAPNSPDNGLTYSSKNSGNGLYGTKLNSDGYAWFAKAAVAGTLRIGAYYSSSNTNAYEVNVYACSSTGTKGDSIGALSISHVGGVSSTLDIDEDVEGIYIVRKTNKEGVLYFVEFKDATPSCGVTAPGDISKGDLTDGEITLTAEGSAESGDTWYWQSSASGTDDSDEYDAENGKTVDAAGTYYLRSYNTSGDCWSDATSITLEDDDFVPHYAITYNKGAYGSGDAIAAGDKTKDVDFTLSSDRYTRAGYLQVGWATSDGGSKAYDLGGTYSDNAALILYPVWAETSTYVASFACASTAPTGWTFSNDGYGDSKGTVDYVCKFVENEIGTPKQTSTGDKTGDDDVAFAKNTDAIATYDLGAACIVTALNITLCGGSSSAFDEEIEYLGADGTTVKKSYTNSLSAGNWKDNVINKNEVVEGVKFIRIHGASKWVVMKAFSVTYVDLTPKYTVTYALNGGSGTTPTETDKKAGAVFTLHNGTTSITAPENKEFDGWLCSANSTKYAGGAEYTMAAANTTFTAQWKAIATKYAVTYVLNGPTGDAPTETNKAEGAEFSLAVAPSWADHVFEGWQWTDDESATHLEDAEAEFTMPAYAVTFTAQWRLDPQATMSNAQYVIGGSALNMAAKFSSLNTSGAVIFSLKESYEGASITAAGSFTATVAGEYIVVAEQAGDGTYANGSAEATVEVLESELSDIYIWSKNSSHGGDGKCVTSDQANQDINANQASTTLAYSTLTMEGMSAIGRPAAAGDVTLTFAVKNAYSSMFGIASVCAYGKIEEPGGIEYSWDNTNWTAVDGGESDNNKHEFEAPAGVYPANFYIRFTNAETGKGGLWLRNALVTLEAKKAIVSTVIDLTDVKINGTSISAANLATLKTGSAYALDLADEYVTAPTVKFNKHTVITYEDDSQVEKDDVISETADVNLSGKWVASAEINEITYTVTMEKADAFIVHYYEAGGETLIGSENVAVSGHPTAAGITPTPQDFKRVVWTLSDEPVELEDVTSAVAGTEIDLVASYVSAYARSINIEQWVLDNSKNNAAFRAVLDAQYYKYADLNDLDSLNVEKNETDRNEPYLGQKVKKTTSAISFLLKAGSTVRAKFGYVGNNVNVIIGDEDPIAKTASDLATPYEYENTSGADVIVKFQSTDTKTVVFKQIMIDEAIATVKLPAVVTYDANGGTFAKISEKYTGTPLVIADATPADEDYEFEGWHVGSVEGEKIDASAYEPTKNVTLVAKYVAKPSPFSLSALTFTIGDGEAQEVGYVEGTYEYDVELPYAGSYETITVAYTLADGTSSVKDGAVLSVPSVPGAATFTVIAANKTEKTYTVNFTKAAKDGLSIIKATVSGDNESAGFDATGLYAGKGYAKTSSKKLNSDNYVGVQLKAGQSFQAGDKLFVVTTTDADRGYIELYQEAAGTNLIKALGVRDASAGIELPSEAYGLSELYIVRKASEGDQSWNGTVNYVEVKRPMNPVLKSITFDGTKIDVTGSTAGETLPYAADLTAVTPEIFWNGAGTATVTTNAGAWAWGDNTYVLTDKDGDATTYTITLVRATRSSDKSLSSLTVDGNAVELKDGVYDYIYEYPYGTDPATVPAVAAEANDAHASVGTITQAGSTAGTASFTVTAEDETTQEYTVKFQISRVKELVIYDGSTMSDYADSGSDVGTGFAWTVVGGSHSEKSAGVTLNGKIYAKGQNIFGSSTASNTRYIEITIPEGYMAKFYLAGATNSKDDMRSSFISKEKTGTLDESIAYVSSDQYSGAYMESDYQFPGTYYYCSNASIRLYELSVTLYSIDYTRETTPGRIGTICLEKGGFMRGAAVYEVAYFNPDNQKIYFDEVLNGEMVPGMPYVFLPDEGNNNQLVVMYGNNAAAAEAGHQNGLYGSFAREELTPNDGNYIFSENKYWFVNSDEIYVGKNRAYLKVEEIYGYEGEPEPAPAVGRRRVSMGAGAQAPNTTTGFDAITNDQSPITNKVLINGQLFILRGQKLYDATGRLVK